MIRLYDYWESGDCYKVRLLLSLLGRPWFAAERYTFADVALYEYTHVAHEGGFDLAPYPALGAWLERVAAEPGHVRIDAGAPPETKP